MIVSTSKMYPGFVPWILLKHYDVVFNGKELGVSGPEGMKVAVAGKGGEKGYVILNNGRRIEGHVVIRDNPPF